MGRQNVRGDRRGAATTWEGEGAPLHYTLCTRVNKCRENRFFGLTLLPPR